MKKDGTEKKSFASVVLGAVYMGIVTVVIGLTFNAISPNSLNLDFTKIQVEKQVETTSPKTDEYCEPYPIYIDEAREYFDRGDVIFIDTRLVEEYKAGRIAGALNIPVDKTIYAFRDLESKLPLDGVYVIYCGGGSCDTAYEVARQFCKRGYRDGNIMVYEDGYETWIEMGMPTEK